MQRPTTLASLFIFHFLLIGVSGQCDVHFLISECSSLFSGITTDAEFCTNLNDTVQCFRNATSSCFQDEADTWASALDEFNIFYQDACIPAVLANAEDCVTTVANACPIPTMTSCEIAGETAECYNSTLRNCTPLSAFWYQDLQLSSLYYSALTCNADPCSFVNCIAPRPSHDMCNSSKEALRCYVDFFNACPNSPLMAQSDIDNYNKTAETFCGPCSSENCIALQPSNDICNSSKETLQCYVDLFNACPNSTLVGQSDIDYYNRTAENNCNPTSQDTCFDSVIASSCYQYDPSQTDSHFCADIGNITQCYINAIAVCNQQERVSWEYAINEIDRFYQYACHPDIIGTLVDCNVTTVLDIISKCYQQPFDITTPLCQLRRNVAECMNSSLLMCSPSSTAPFQATHIQAIYNSSFYCGTDPCDLGELQKCSYYLFVNASTLNQAQICNSTTLNVQCMLDYSSTCPNSTYIDQNIIDEYSNAIDIVCNNVTNTGSPVSASSGSTTAPPVTESPAPTIHGWLSWITLLTVMALLILYNAQL